MISLALFHLISFIMLERVNLSFRSIHKDVWKQLKSALKVGFICSVLITLGQLSLCPGNKYLNQLTATRKCKLRIDMVNWDDISGYALYDTFDIGDESSGFMLTVGGYSGNTGLYICLMYVMLI